MNTMKTRNKCLIVLISMTTTGITKFCYDVIPCIQRWNETPYGIVNITGSVHNIWEYLVLSFVPQASIITSLIIGGIVAVTIPVVSYLYKWFKHAHKVWVMVK